MRDICEGCPCFEIQLGNKWCFWYDSYVDNTGCGNSFDARPELNQWQLEKKVAAMSKEEIEEVFLKYQQGKIDDHENT